MLPLNQTQSEHIGDIATALAKAQLEIESASFDKINPHFKSGYASYSSIREECRLPLSRNGLAITHQMDLLDGKRILITQLSHTSGQWMRSYILVPQERETPQAMGSAISYCKRYGLSAFIAIGTDDDDDGEEAEKPYREPSKLSSTQAKEIEDRCKDSEDPEILNRILKAYKVTNLNAINASEFQSILKRIHITREQSNAKTGT